MFCCLFTPIRVYRWGECLCVKPTALKVKIGQSVRRSFGLQSNRIINVYRSNEIPAVGCRSFRKSVKYKPSVRFRSNTSLIGESHRQIKLPIVFDVISDDGREFISSDGRCYRAVFRLAGRQQNSAVRLNDAFAHL